MTSAANILINQDGSLACSELELSQLNTLFGKASNQAATFPERMIKGLSPTLLETSPAVIIEDRESFYQDIKYITDSPIYQSLIGKVTLSTLIPSVTEARADLGAFLCLYYLTPFTLKTDGSAEALAALGATHPELESKWQQDNQLTPEQIANGEANFSDLYLADRAAMLSWVNKLNSEDFTDPNNGFGYVTDTASQHFEDKNTGKIIDINKISNTRRYFIFGENIGPVNADTITGGDNGDHLYGMAGADTLNGGKGSDWLEGGADDDYIDGGNGDNDFNFGRHATNNNEWRMAA